ncbi:hypothetical protein WICPIJ_004737 [Wickerhamomyces pijperi]|uniref:Secreted protein n=1 Tax=Wickerhamomyces pijperi TaxID=599730 RepID=A0A9P8Q746_WICPI|nr:hypothetical protein WICPIJ_004737 [Wickerhamomyces pijperi]
MAANLLMVFQIIIIMISTCSIAADVHRPLHGPPNMLYRRDSTPQPSVDPSFETFLKNNNNHQHSLNALHFQDSFNCAIEGANNSCFQGAFSYFATNASVMKLNSTNTTTHSKTNPKQVTLLDGIYAKKPTSVSRFRLAYSGLSASGAVDHQLVFSTLFNGTWFGENGFSEMLTRTNGLKDIFDSLDILYPKMFLQCVNAENSQIKKAYPSEDLGYFENLSFKPRNIDSNQTSTIGSFDSSLRFPNHENLQIKQIPNKKLSKLTKIRHTFRYELVNSKDKTFNKCSGIGYILEFTYSPQLHTVTYQFTTPITYKDPNQAPQCSEMFKNDEKRNLGIHWSEIINTCRNELYYFLQSANTFDGGAQVHLRHSGPLSTTKNFNNISKIQDPWANY